MARAGSKPPALRPESSAAWRASSRRPYLVQVGDQIEVKFFYSPELNDTPLVRPDGRISLQLAGEVPAAGHTPAQLTTAIREAYRGTLEDPEITVAVKQYAPQRVYVAGEVGRPGEVVLAGELSALQAVIQAGDFTQDGERRSVVVLRNTGDETPAFLLLDFVTPPQQRSLPPGIDAAVCDNGPIAECDRWMAALHPEQFVLQPTDIVFVPQTKVASVSQFFQRYIGNILPIFRNMAIGLSYDLNPPDVNLD